MCNVSRCLLAVDTDNPAALGPLTLAHNRLLRLPKYVKMFVLFLFPCPFSSSFRSSWLSSYISVR